jgi:hypothetical protein
VRVQDVEGLSPEYSSELKHREQIRRIQKWEFDIGVQRAVATAGNSDLVTASPQRFG